MPRTPAHGTDRVTGRVSGRGTALPARLGRSVCLAFACWGLALVVRPAAMCHLFTARPVPPVWLVRLLGARLLLQHGLIAAAPSRRAVLAAGTLDALHALSMAALVTTAPSRKRVAALGAATALGSLLGGLPATRGKPRRARSER